MKFFIFLVVFLIDTDHSVCSLFQLLHSIRSGHRANIFSAKFLPCSGDKWVGTIIYFEKHGMWKQTGFYPSTCSHFLQQIMGSIILLSCTSYLAHCPHRVLVGCKSTTGLPPADTHLYIWVERGTARVKCVAQEHNVM